MLPFVHSQSKTTVPAKHTPAKHTPKILGEAPDIVLPPFTVDVWENDRDIVRLRRHFTPAMRVVWDKGIDAFIAGDWMMAREQFNLVLTMTEQKDGSSLDMTITNEEIINCINSLRSSCASGIDGTCIEMFKCTSHKIAPSLNKLFNNILQTNETVVTGVIIFAL